MRRKSCRIRLCAEQAHERLILLCSVKTSTLRIKGNALGALSNMAMQSNVIGQLLDSGLMNVIVQLCMSCDDLWVVRNAIGALLNIVRGSEASHARILRDSDVLSMLIGCATKIEDDGVVDNIVSVLVLFAQYAHCCDAMLDAGVCSCVVQLCNENQRPAVLENTARLVCNLSKHTDMHVRLITERIPAAVAGLCAEHLTTRCQLHACSALARLAKCAAKRLKWCRRATTTCCRMQPFKRPCSR